MKVPPFFSELLGKLLDRLCFLLPESSRPQNKNFIVKEKMSQDPDIQRVQAFYNLFFFVLKNVIPQIEKYDNEDELKEYLNGVLIFIATQEWGRVVLSSVSQSLSSLPNLSSSQTSSSSSQTAASQVSQNSEKQSLQQLYEIASSVVHEIAPVATASALAPKAKVKKIIESLISTHGEVIKRKILPLITSQFHKALSERHGFVPELGKVIPPEQLSKDGGTQLIQLLYNAACLGLDRMLLLCKQLVSEEKMTIEGMIQSSAEETKFFLQQINPFFEQINVLFLDKIWESLPLKNRPFEKRTFVLEGQMSSDLGVKLVQTGYNLACVMFNEIIPDIQKQEWKSITDLIGNPLTWKAGYGIKPIKLLLTHLNPLKEQLKISFIDTVWNSLLEGERLSKREIIPEDKISQDPEVQIKQCFYNVACFLLNEVFPKMQECDSLVGLGWYLVNQIQPLLKHLSPFITQMKRILIDDAYRALPPGARSKKPGKRISEEGLKFSQDTDTRFKQITYDCACLLFNKILPEIEGCGTRAGVLESILNPGESFREMGRLMNDIGFRFNYQKEEFFNGDTKNNAVIEDEKTIFSFIGEKLFPLLMGILEVLAPVEEKIQPLFSEIKNLLEPVTQSFTESVEKFLAPIKEELVKNKADLFEPSTNLFNAFYALFDQSYALVSSKTMEGHLSYQAACIIYETSNNLMSQLIPLYEKETNYATRKEYQLLYKYFVAPITIIQWEIKEERAFVPALVREFIPKMNAVKDEINQLMTALNLVGDAGFKPSGCEQYLASISVIEAKKDKCYSEFQELMATTKTLSGVQDQKVIAYESSLPIIETTTQSKLPSTAKTTQSMAHGKPIVLKFSECEAEVLKNSWNPFVKVFNAKKQQIEQLKANNAYLSSAYKKVVAENFDDIQSLLAEGISTGYSPTYHQKLFSASQQLKKVKLDEALVNGLPHRQFETAYRGEIHNYNALLDKTHENLEKGLKDKLNEQKKCFTDFIVDALTKKISAIASESQQKLVLINSLFGEISLKNPESTKLCEYEKQVELIRVWLVEIQSDAVVHAVLREKGLTDFGCVNGWLADFSKTEAYQNYTRKVKELTKPLIETIAEHDAKLKLANGQQVEKLQTDITFFNEKLRECESNLKAVIEEMKLAYHTDTDQEFQLDDEKRKLIVEISPFVRALDLTELNMACTSSDLDQLLIETNKKLEALTEQRNKQAISSVSHTPINALYNQVSNANTFKEFENITDALVKEVQELMDPLSSDSLAAYIKDLKDDMEIKANKQEVIKLLTGFLPAPSSEEVVVSDATDEKKSCDTLGTLISQLKAVLTQQQIYQKWSGERASAKNEITFKTIQIKLAQLRAALTDAREVLSELSEKFKVVVKKLEKEVANVLTFEEMGKKNAIRNVVLSLALLKIKVFQAEASIRKEACLEYQKTYNAIQIEIAAIIYKLPNDPAAQALASVAKILFDELPGISKHVDEIYAETKAQVTEIENEKKILLAEQEAIPNYVTTLKNANDLVENLHKTNVEIKKREYPDNILDLFKKATFLNPSDILDEDTFYEETKKGIACFEAELKKLNESAIKKDNLSSLENTFNKALNEKIEEVKAALQQAKTNYDRLQKDWESLAVQYPIIKNSRALSKVPNNVAATLADCKGQDLRGIHLTDKKFKGVSFQYANLSESHFERCDFSECDLQSVNFKGATLKQCTSINFKGVILDKNTKLDWENDGGKILFDNLSDPLFKPAQANYLRDLIATVKSKMPIHGEWVLEILKKIGQSRSFRPWTHLNEVDLIAQQNHAVFVIKQLIPQMDSIQDVLKLKDLVDKKDHIEELFETPLKASEREKHYAFIRRELDIFRFKYGNTQPWKEIMQTIQARLNELAGKPNVKLTKEDYEAGERIMKTHVKHDYGFGFFYTPSVSSEWEALKSTVIPTVQATC